MEELHISNDSLKEIVNEAKEKLLKSMRAMGYNGDLKFVAFRVYFAGEDEGEKFVLYCEEKIKGLKNV